MKRAMRLFPKLAAMLVVAGVSSALFVAWYIIRYPEALEQQRFLDRYAKMWEEGPNGASSNPSRTMTMAELKAEARADAAASAQKIVKPKSQALIDLEAEIIAEEAEQRRAKSQTLRELEAEARAGGF